MANGSRNQIREEDLPIHNWYRFILSYPPHLVTEYLAKLEVGPGDWVLDPFCGTGTTMVECRKRGFRSFGTEAHPVPLFASRVKTNWDLATTLLRDLLRRIVSQADSRLVEMGLPRMSFDTDLVSDGSVVYEVQPLALSEDEKKILPTGFVSIRPLTRLLLLRHVIEERTDSQSDGVREFFLLGLAAVAVNGAGNFAFGPEIYRTAPKDDYDVTAHFSRHVSGMIDNLEEIQRSRPEYPACVIRQDDARMLQTVDKSIGAVITSPPYPNEKDYTRTTRVESILLKLVRSKDDLRAVKERLLRSNTRNVFVKDNDADLVADIPEIRKICTEIESRRIELGKTSGFERLYHKVVAHYFGGMRRHFQALFRVLAPGAKCAYVVGDQLSFLMVPVLTADLLGIVAEREGFDILGCELWRERVGTKIRNARQPAASVRVRENVLLLRKS